MQAGPLKVACRGCKLRDSLAPGSGLGPKDVVLAAHHLGGGSLLLRSQGARRRCAKLGGAALPGWQMGCAPMHWPCGELGMISPTPVM